ncbi:unnamed protein product [Amoebophrya sp. A25]|nr:unnamed protein product [Amoebophrya sp. A25]|eukprot:GSA25T00022627001.1
MLGAHHDTRVSKLLCLIAQHFFCHDVDGCMLATDRSGPSEAHIFQPVLQTRCDRSFFCFILYFSLSFYYEIRNELLGLGWSWYHCRKSMPANSVLDVKAVPLVSLFGVRG